MRKNGSKIGQNVRKLRKGIYYNLNSIICKWPENFEAIKKCLQDQSFLYNLDIMSIHCIGVTIWGWQAQLPPMMSTGKGDKKVTLGPRGSMVPQV